MTLQINSNQFVIESHSSLSARARISPQDPSPFLTRHFARQWLKRARPGVDATIYACPRAALRAAGINDQRRIPGARKPSAPAYLTLIRQSRVLRDGIDGSLTVKVQRHISALSRK